MSGYSDSQTHETPNFMGLTFYYVSQTRKLIRKLATCTF